MRTTIEDRARAAAERVELRAGFHLKVKDEILVEAIAAEFADLADIIKDRPILLNRVSTLANELADAEKRLAAVYAKCLWWQKDSLRCNRAAEEILAILDGKEGT